MPAPASQAIDVPPLWSRPVAPCVNGWRPNSVLKTTSVSSIRPRAFRSRSKAAIGRSTLRAIGGNWLGMSLWLSQLFAAPPAPLQTCTNRTPALQQPAGQQAAAAKVGRGGVVQSVESTRGRRLAGQVEGLGRTALHAGRQLVGGDP